MVLWVIAGANVALAQSSSFTYQGRLTDGGTPANGNYDLQFALWNSLSGGAQVGSPQTINTVAVSNGVFTVSLDFGASAFTGPSRFLEIGARPAGSGSFTPLTPRQEITSTPYAVRSLNAASADSVPASGVPAGSGNYIQNSNSPQGSSNFNISGDGTAGGTLTSNVVNATTQYNLNGNRILSTPGPGNLFAGPATGPSTTGTFNSFFGNGAGSANTTGSHDSFFGGSAGALNMTGEFNSIFGSQAGRSNVIGVKDSFFGSFAGVNATGSFNTFVGFGADFDAPGSASGDRNTLLGAATRIRTTPLFSPINATAIGANAQVDASNALVLGSISNVNGATADTNVGIGTTAPATRLHVVGTTGLVGNVGIGTTSPDRTLTVAGRARISSIPQEPSGASLCFDINGNLLQCGASSLKWKTNVRPFRSGLGIIQRLRPISFNWKENGRPDVGLGAEDVAKVAPSFTFTDDKGEVTGVKYERLSMLLINAIKEQQQEIARLNARLQTVERALRKKTSAARRR